MSEAETKWFPGFSPEDTCNALLLVGPGHVECQSHTQEPFDHYSPEHGVGWSDGTPGAQPHVPPARYTVQELTGDFEVWDELPGEAARVVAMFNKRHHPFPETAARAEAGRLNGERGRSPVRPPDPPPSPPGRKHA